MAQLVERLPDTQNVAGSNPTWGSSLEKEELSLGVVALLRLVSMTEHTCMWITSWEMFTSPAVWQTGVDIVIHMWPHLLAGLYSNAALNAHLHHPGS